MGIIYNKEFQPKDRRVMPSGPRDRQIRQISQITNSDQSLLINELRSQISKLQEQLDNSQNTISGYTAEQVDEEIIKSVKSETEKLRAQHEYEKNNLQNIINSKDEIIQHLKNNQNISSGLTEDKIASLILEATKNLSSTSNSDSFIKNDRPKMETVFIDPIEKETNLEKHFGVEEVGPNEKIQLDDKVNKLKGLLGKLPSKRN